MPFLFEKTTLSDVLLVSPQVFGDHRGGFAELYKESAFQEAGIDARFVQVNHSFSQRNVLRGLHYQLHPRAQAKLVSVIRGEIFDVAVDIRRGSPDFGKWFGVCLSYENRKMLYIPAGFAHGFCVRSDEAEIVYYCSEEYAPDLERSLIWNDPQLAIDWPIQEPLLSSKDQAAKRFQEAENNFEYSEAA